MKEKQSSILREAVALRVNSPAICANRTKKARATMREEISVIGLPCVSSKWVRLGFVRCLGVGLLVNQLIEFSLDRLGGYSKMLGQPIMG